MTDRYIIRTTGQTGPGSVAGSISVADTAGNYTGTNVESVLAELPSRFVPVFSPMAYGAAGDGSTDDTTAVQAAITACPVGGQVRIDRRYKVSSLTCDKAIAFVGNGYNSTVGAAFGNAQWTNASGVTGSVLILTATSGDAFSVSTNGQPVFRDLAILGPGSGTSIGLAIADAKFVVSNLFVANFGTGVELDGMTHGLAQGLRILGCGTGLSLTNAANNNWFSGTEVQFSGTYGITFSSDSSNNGFAGGIVQNCAGTAGLNIAGLSNNFYGNWWFENNTTTNIIDIPSGSGGRARLTDFYISGTNAVRIQANGVTCESWIGQGGTTTITNTGTQNIFIQCDSSPLVLTDSGSATTIISSGGTSKVNALNASTTLKVTSTGVGFNGTAATAKPTVTGSRGSNAALASLLTALASLGLITDSSS